ncbi:hypothetical protein PLICRDRAFT_28395 [Plicaturopsis crispa FD-325 SS-3]|nr:hypothetical protein PLICRDRAFT_28395 [Plicaturopsis crispa FD-325 SS-3]
MVSLACCSYLSCSCFLLHGLSSIVSVMFMLFAAWSLQRLDICDAHVFCCMVYPACYLSCSCFLLHGLSSIVSVMFMLFAAWSLQERICDAHVPCCMVSLASSCECHCLINDYLSFHGVSLIVQQYWHNSLLLTHATLGQNLSPWDQMTVSSKNTHCIILSHGLETFHTVSWSNFLFVLMEHSFWCNGEDFNDKFKEAVTEYKKSPLPNVIEKMSWDPHPWPKTPNALQDRWQPQNMHRPIQGMQKQSKSLWKQSHCLSQ